MVSESVQPLLARNFQQNSIHQDIQMPSFPNFAAGIPPQHGERNNPISSQNSNKAVNINYIKRHTWPSKPVSSTEFTRRTTTQAEHSASSTKAEQVLNLTTQEHARTIRHAISITSALPSSIQKFRNEIQKADEAHHESLTYWEQRRHISDTLIRANNLETPQNTYELYLKIPTTALVKECSDLEPSKRAYRNFRQYWFDTTFQYRLKRRIDLREWEFAMGEPSTGEADGFEYNQSEDPIFGRNRRRRRRSVVGGDSGRREGEVESRAESKKEEEKKMAVVESSGSATGTPQTRQRTSRQTVKKFKTDWNEQETSLLRTEATGGTKVSDWKFSK